MGSGCVLGSEASPRAKQMTEYDMSNIGADYGDDGNDRV